MNLSLSSMNHVMGHFYSETQFGKDLELNVVRIWVLHRVSLPKPANSLSRKEHLLRSGGSGALATLWDTFAPCDSAVRSSAATSVPLVGPRRPADVPCTQTGRPAGQCLCPHPDIFIASCAVFSGRIENYADIQQAR